MNPSATIPSTQMIFSWTLLGVLLAWTCFCALLALHGRGRKNENREATDLPTPSGAFPAIVSRTQAHHAVHQRVAVPGERAFNPAPGVPSEAASEIGSAPVA